MGIAKVNASTNEKPAVNAPEVKFTADITTAHIASGDLNVDKKEVVADGTKVATYTAKVTDARGNILPDYEVVWSTDVGTLDKGTSTTDENGIATIELSHTVAEKATVTATVRKKDRKAPVVQFIADVSTAKITVESAKQKITGTGVETTTLTATVVDANNNPIYNYALK